MKLAIGAAQFGLEYGISNVHGIVQDHDIESILSHAVINGIDTVDTAQAYGNCEEKLGQFDLTKFNIVTKLSPGTSAGTLVSSAKESLKRLNIQKLHGLMFHSFDDFKKNPDVIKELAELRDNGTVDKIGFSLYYSSDLEYLLDSEICFDLVQIPFSIFDQRFKAYFSELREAMIEIHVRSIYLQGLVFIAPEELNPFFHGYRGLLQRLRNLSEEQQISISSLCLHYVNSFEQIGKIVVGVSSLTEFQKNTQELLSIPGNLNAILPMVGQFEIEDENIILPFNWKLT